VPFWADSILASVRLSKMGLAPKLEKTAAHKEVLAKGFIKTVVVLQDTTIKGWPACCDIGAICWRGGREKCSFPGTPLYELTKRFCRSMNAFLLCRRTFRVATSSLPASRQLQQERTG